MATQATAVPTNNARNRQMQEIKAPEMFQFTKEEPALEGTLLGISRVQVKGKDTTQYMIQDVDGNRLTFLATYDLARKIQLSHVGHWIYVQYEGEDPDIKTQGSPLKKFRVAISQNLEPGFKNLAPAIGDEEIPF